MSRPGKGGSTAGEPEPQSWTSWTILPTLTMMHYRDGCPHSPAKSFSFPLFLPKDCIYISYKSFHTSACLEIISRVCVIYTSNSGSPNHISTLFHIFYSHMHCTFTCFSLQSRSVVFTRPYFSDLFCGSLQGVKKDGKIWLGFFPFQQ